jgi:hypothetical protein
MEYKVIWAVSIEKLEAEIKKYISQGWIPQGGIGLSPPYGNAYAQAMIRK